MSKDNQILQEKLNLINAQIVESRIYIEIALITLFLIFFAFFTEKSFVDYIMKNKIYGYTVLIVVVLMTLTIFYILYFLIIHLNKKRSHIKERKKMSNRDWTE